MKGALIVVGVLVLLGLLLFMPLMSARNELVAERESVTTAWSQVENVMQRRADLIPNLVETVKGFAKHEQSVIDSITAARAALGGARTPQEKIAANDQLGTAISRLL